jgi:hypothetical protein
VVGIVAEENAHHPHKALNRGARSRHQQQRQSNLEAIRTVCHCFPRTVLATLRELVCMTRLISGRASCKFVNQVGKLFLASLVYQCRKQPKNYAGEESETNTEK